MNEQEVVEKVIDNELALLKKLLLSYYDAMRRYRTAVHVLIAEIMDKPRNLFEPVSNQLSHPVSDYRNEFQLIMQRLLEIVNTPESAVLLHYTDEAMEHHLRLTMSGLQDIINRTDAELLKIAEEIEADNV